MEFQHFPRNFIKYSGKLEFKDNFFVTLAKENIDSAIENSLKNHAGIHYIKLHGSYGWKSFDGSNQMVIGKSKWESIKKEPLLYAYFNILKNIIKEGDKKLLIIGYGFRDQHINELLLEGVQENNLKLYIITTMTPQGFDENLYNGHYYAMGLKKGISGFFPYRLAQILPPNQNGSVHLDEIKKALMGR